jgi:hypothetical protein
MNKRQAIARLLRADYDGAPVRPPSHEAWAALLEGTGGALGAIKIINEETARFRMRGGTLPLD